MFRLAAINPKLQSDFERNRMFNCVRLAPISCEFDFIQLPNAIESNHSIGLGWIRWNRSNVQFRSIDYVQLSQCNLLRLERSRFGIMHVT